MNCLESIRAEMGRHELVAVKAILETYVHAIDSILAMDRTADGIPVIDFLAKNESFVERLDRAQDVLGAVVFMTEPTLPGVRS